MSSTNWGKDQIKEYIMRNVPSGSTCLDVGACDGKYWQMLHDHLGSMDAVEIFQPNIDRHRLNEKYNHVFNQSVVGLEYDHYDLIIFGDIIEHLTVEDAQQVLAYAQTHADEIIVAVPFLYPQPAIYGNSSVGEVLALERRFPYYKPEHQIKPRKTKRGYLQVDLRVDNTKRAFAVHRLVAKAFIPNPDNKPEIDHIDGDPTNNHVWNLRWVTHAENMNNPITKQRISDAHKRKNAEKRKVKSK